MKKTVLFITILLALGSMLWAQQNVSAPQKFALVSGRQHPELSLRFPRANSTYLSRRPSLKPTPQPIPSNMVLINGGTFTMGSPADEPHRFSDEIQHQVTISSFFIGKYEVTQKEYQEVMETNPSNFKGDNLPVEQVSWFDAVEFCNALSLREGLTPAYTIDRNSIDPNNKDKIATVRWLVTWNQNANGYRLPTEAEWEYACRAGTTTPFNTGNNITTENANYNGHYPYNNNARGTNRDKTTAVGSFAPNPWGLYDMHGNVWEWCWDWHGPYPKSAQTDPVGVSSGSDRVHRGGAWNNAGRFLRSAYQFFNSPSGRGNFVGFRLVRTQFDRLKQELRPRGVRRER
jgi:formylglycine-generating enzyme required for sulfatase activity